MTTQITTNSFDKVGKWFLFAVVAIGMLMPAFMVAGPTLIAIGGFVYYGLCLGSIAISVICSISQIAIVWVCWNAWKGYRKSKATFG